MDAAVRALAEPTRREILRLVRDDERTAGDIAKAFPISRPAVSQHLRVLEEAELVDVRRDGTKRWYRARPEGLAELQTWLTSMWTDQLADLKRAAEQEEWPARARKRARATGTTKRQPPRKRKGTP
jgi:DNA-binding transcriptional ArsR family regulator